MPDTLETDVSLRVSNVTKRFGDFTAVDDLSFNVRAGRVFGFLGPNGAGKTTLLRTLATINSPTSGEILFDGLRLERDRIDLRKRFFFLPDLAMAIRSTVLEQISAVVAIYEAEREGLDDAIIEWLIEFDMLPLVDASLSKLSRGQVYKTALISLLAVSPDLWLMDEPFASGMDPRGLTGFRREAQAAIERGATILYTTQILELAESFSDKVCILHEGRIRAFDDFANLRQQFSQSEDESPESIFHRAIGDAL